MAASFPNAVKSFGTRSAGQTIASSHVNDMQDEIVAIETALTDAGLALAADGGGATNDAAAFASALLTSTTLRVQPGTYRIGTDLTVPATAALEFSVGAELSIDSGVTVTVLGAILAPRTQIFSGLGAVDLIDAKIDGVYPEWWGAVALKAPTGTPADSTTAIEKATNSKRDVLFDQGIYGTSGGHIMTTDGQRWVGQGLQHGTGANGQGGTTIKRLSGTSVILTMSGDKGMAVERLNFHGNNIGARSLTLSSCHEACVRDVSFTDVGGTSYALYLSNANVSSFYNLTFHDSNYGHIQTDSGAMTGNLYCKFYNTIMGTADGGYGLDLQNASFFSFFSLYIDAPIRTGANCRSPFFADMRVEFNGSATALLTTDATLWGLTIHGLYFKQTGASVTHPVLDLVASRSHTITDFHYEDLVSAGGRVVIRMNGALYTSIKTAQCYSTNAFDFIGCTGTRSDQLEVANAVAHSGAAGMVDLKASVVELTNCILDVEAQASTETVTLINHAGTVTKTNIAGLVLINTSDQTPLDFASGDATPSLIGGGGFYRTANAAPTTITTFDDAQFSGQKFSVLVNDANTTFDFSGTTLKGNNGSDYVAAVGDMLLVEFRSPNFYCWISQG